MVPTDPKIRALFHRVAVKVNACLDEGCTPDELVNTVFRDPGDWVSSPEQGKEILKFIDDILSDGPDPVSSRFHIIRNVVNAAVRGWEYKE